MSTKYIYTFAIFMTVVVGFLLAGSIVVLGPLAEVNADIFNKRQILEAVKAPMAEAGQEVAALSDQEVLDLFDTQVTQTVVDATGQPVPEAVNADGTVLTAIDLDLAQERKKPLEERLYPVYELSFNDNSYYIFSVRGSGLWDAIWGNVALESDMNTVAGVAFDHAGETPGLGAEIKDNEGWKAQFVGKKIYDGDKYVSVYIRKGGAIDPDHEVDGLSGATVTADGVTKMLYEGLKVYEPYMEEAEKATSMNLK